MSATAQDLVALLDLENLDIDLYRGQQADTARQRVFGGQVAAQALVAASRSCEPQFVLHSLHSYFLRPGDPSVPIIYEVERLRDGRSFLSRRVVARQHGRPIYFQASNFQVPEEGFEHQDVMPQVPLPEQGVPMEDLIAIRGQEHLEGWRREWGGLEIRHLGTSTHGLPEDPEHPAKARLWVRVAGDLGDDPVLHQAAFTFATDLTLLGATLVPHKRHLGSTDVMPASLDHTVWFQRPMRADRWWLYDQASPSASGGRGLALARVFSQDGTLVAVIAQEGLIRRLT